MYNRPFNKKTIRIFMALRHVGHPADSWHQYALAPQPAIQGVDTTTAETQTDLVSGGTCANPSCERAAEEACTAANKCCAKCCLGRIAV